MSELLFSRDGKWEFGLFEHGGAEVSAKGYKRIPITEATFEIKLPDIFIWNFYTPGGTWKPKKPGVYDAYAMRDGVKIVLIKPGYLLTITKLDAINIGANQKVVDATCPRCGDHHRCEAK